MRLSIGPVEAVWLTITITTLALAFSAFRDARRDREAVTALNGRAREIAADGTVTQEAYAVVLQLILIGMVVTELFRDRDVEVSPIVGGLMLIPIVLFLKSLSRARTRRALIGLIATDLKAENKAAFAQLGAALKENTRISQEASDHADAAYHEANTVNAKIASLGEDRQATTEAISETLSDTHEKTLEIHDVVVNSEPKP